MKTIHHCLLVEDWVHSPCGGLKAAADVGDKTTVTNVGKRQAYCCKHRKPGTLTFTETIMFIREGQKAGKGGGGGEGGGVCRW